MTEPDDTARALGKGRVSSLNLDRLTIAELMAVIEEAETLRREKQEEAKAALLAKWQAEAAENSLSLDIVLEGQKPEQAQSGKARRRTGGTVAAKFRNPETGATWSGRGREPTWIKGKNREEFKI
jgi:DNA-binding protein H-NS